MSTLVLAIPTTRQLLHGFFWWWFTARRHSLWLHWTLAGLAALGLLFMVGYVVASSLERTRAPAQIRDEPSPVQEEGGKLRFYALVFVLGVITIVLGIPLVLVSAPFWGLIVVSAGLLAIAEEVGQLVHIR